MRRRRRYSRQKAEVELNLAAMLDMAFQLLAFFILTFHPSPIEGQLSLHLPPAGPITNPSNRPDKAEAIEGGTTTAKTLDLSVFSEGGGGVSRVQVGMNPAFSGPADEANLHKLDQRMRQAFGLEASPFEQVVIRFSPRLRYEELMKIVDVCMKQKMPDGQTLRKISFVEMADTAAAGSPNSSSPAK